jgi:hypothetical protein
MYIKYDIQAITSKVFIILTMLFLFLQGADDSLKVLLVDAEILIKAFAEACPLVVGNIGLI